jgi:hypothetical protein
VFSSFYQHNGHYHHWDGVGGVYIITYTIDGDCHEAEQSAQLNTSFDAARRLSLPQQAVGIRMFQHVFGGHELQL